MFSGFGVFLVGLVWFWGVLFGFCLFVYFCLFAVFFWVWGVLLLLLFWLGFWLLLCFVVWVLLLSTFPGCSEPFWGVELCFELCPEVYSNSYLPAALKRP